MSGGLEQSRSFQESLNDRLDAWADRFGSKFVLGLSGGGDSMALALGCAKWVATGKGQVHAVCVDHGLRARSAEEARQTVTWARALGLTAQIVSLGMESGQSRVQERARAGRHNALCEGAKVFGARVILLAHTQNDQQETVALRLASRTGLDGLAGMSELSPSPFYSDDWPCLLGRPLLDHERGALRAHLMQAGQSWHDDPSNADMNFGRIRARARLAHLVAQGGDVQSLSRIAKHAGVLRQKRDEAACALLHRAELTIESDSLSVSNRAMVQACPSVCQRVLGWLAFSAGNALRAPLAEQSARLQSAIMGPRFRGATLAGAKFQGKGNRLIVETAPPRKGQKQAIGHNNTQIGLRLAAISANLDQFVTHLG